MAGPAGATCGAVVVVLAGAVVEDRGVVPGGRGDVGGDVAGTVVSDGAVDVAVGSAGAVVSGSP